MKWDHLWTESDGDTLSLPAVSGIAALLLGVGTQGFDVVVLHHEFNMATFGTGVAAIIAATAAAMRIKPPRDDPQGDHQ